MNTKKIYVLFALFVVGIITTPTLLEQFHRDAIVVCGVFVHTHRLPDLEKIHSDSVDRFTFSSAYLSPSHYEGMLPWIQFMRIGTFLVQCSDTVRSDTVRIIWKHPHFKKILSIEIEPRKPYDETVILKSIFEFLARLKCFDITDDEGFALFQQKYSPGNIITSWKDLVDLPGPDILTNLFTNPDALQTAINFFAGSIAIGNPLDLVRKDGGFFASLDDNGHFFVQILSANDPYEEFDITKLKGSAQQFIAYNVSDANPSESTACTINFEGQLIEEKGIVQTPPEILEYRERIIYKTTPAVTEYITLSNNDLPDPEKYGKYDPLKSLLAAYGALLSRGISNCKVNSHIQHGGYPGYLTSILPSSPVEYVSCGPVKFVIYPGGHIRLCVLQDDTVGVLDIHLETPETQPGQPPFGLFMMPDSKLENLIRNILKAAIEVKSKDAQRLDKFLDFTVDKQLKKQLEKYGLTTESVTMTARIPLTKVRPLTVDSITRLSHDASSDKSIKAIVSILFGNREGPLSAQSIFDTAVGRILSGIAPQSEVKQTTLKGKHWTELCRVKELDSGTGLSSDYGVFLTSVPENAKYFANLPRFLQDMQKTSKLEAQLVLLGQNDKGQELSLEFDVRPSFTLKGDMNNLLECIMLWPAQPNNRFQPGSSGCPSPNEAEKKSDAGTQRYWVDPFTMSDILS